MPVSGDLINSLYLEILGRHADPIGLALRVNQTPAEIRADLYASDEYAELQRLKNAPPGDATAPDREARNRERLDAKARLEATLRTVGLESLAGWAWDRITADASEATILLELQDQPAFIASTIGKVTKARRDRNLPAMSFAEIAEYTNRRREILHAAGFPRGFNDSDDDVVRDAVNEVGLPELKERADAAVLATFATPEIQSELSRFFGIARGELAAAIWDTNRGIPLIRQKVAAAQISGAGIRTGFGALSEEQATRLANLGVSESEAEEGLGQLQSMRELATPINRGESAISREEQLAVLEGNVAAQERYRRRAEERKAEFAGGGSFFETREGVTGLGRAR